MPCPSLRPVGPGSYWCYASPPQKLLESKAQKDNLMGGSGTKGYHHSASNTWIRSGTYCPHPEVSVPALGYQYGRDSALSCSERFLSVQHFFVGESFRPW